MASAEFTDIRFTIKDRVGTIKFNRPDTLNSIGGNLVPDTVAALRILNDHPDTAFTVLTGEGRFFSAGADIKAISTYDHETFKNAGERKLAFAQRFSHATELMRSMIDHKKVLILALNGPAIGAGAAWFPGIADLVLASSSSYLQCPFSALGLVPENGSVLSLGQHVGIHRANDFLMTGRKLSAHEAEAWGLVNRVFDAKGPDFQEQVAGFLRALLEANDAKSMMEVKRLQNQPIREKRMMAVVDALDAVAERFVDGAPLRRFQEKRRQLEERKQRAKL